MLVSTEAAGQTVSPFESRDPDPATLVTEKPATCGKKCGSNNCRHELIKKRCPGQEKKACISSERSTESDRAEAVACMGGQGNASWLQPSRNSGYD